MLRFFFVVYNHVIEMSAGMYISDGVSIWMVIPTNSQIVKMDVW